MAAVATLKALLGLDSTQFKAGMRDAQGATKGLQASISSIGKSMAAAFTIGSVVNAGRTILQWADRISTAAQNVGILSSEMLAFNNVALQSNVSVESMQRALAKIKNTISDAFGGNEEARKKIEGLNLSLSDLAKLDTAGQLRAVMKAAIDTGIPLEALSKILGERLGPNFVAFAKQMADLDTTKLNDGLGQTVDKLERMSDQVALLKEQMMGFGATSLAVIMNLHARVTDFLGGAISQLGDDLSNLAQLASTGTYDPKRAAPGGFIGAGIRSDVMGRTDEDIASMNRGTAEATAKEKARLQQEKALAAGNRTLADEAGRKIMDAENKAYMDATEKARKALEKFAEATEKARQAEQEKLLDAYAKQEEDANDRAKSAYEERQRGAEDIKALSEPGRNTGSGINADSLAQVGGFIGPQRAGLAGADRSAQIAEETFKIQQRTDANVEKICTVILSYPNPLGD